MKLTKDLSQCQDCVFYRVEQDIATCYCSGKGLILDGKWESCPDYASVDTAAQMILSDRKASERAKKEAQERAEEERKKQEEYERTHPKEYWTLRYHWQNPLSYEILSHSGKRPLYPVDNDEVHWEGEADDDMVYYVSTQEKAYQKYKEVLEEEIEDIETKLLEMKERLTFLKSSGMIK